MTISTPAEETTGDQSPRSIDPNAFWTEKLTQPQVASQATLVSPRQPSTRGIRSLIRGLVEIIINVKRSIGGSRNFLQRDPATRKVGEDQIEGEVQAFLSGTTLTEVPSADLDSTTSGPQEADVQRLVDDVHRVRINTYFLSRNKVKMFYFIDSRKRRL